jgi:hypothetical protein
MDPNEVRENRERKKRRDYEMAKQRRIQSEMMHVEEVKHRYLCARAHVHALWSVVCSIFMAPAVGGREGTFQKRTFLLVCRMASNAYA